MSTHVPLGFDCLEKTGALPEDKLLMTLDTGLNTVITIFHDLVFDAVITRLTRPITSGDKRIIALEADELEMLHSHAERIVQLKDKYADTGRNIDITFDLGVLLRGRLNFNGLGYLDIRRFATKSDETEIPTTHGVRIPVVELSTFCEKIAVARNYMVEQKKQLKNIVKKMRLALMHQQIVIAGGFESAYDTCAACEMGKPAPNHTCFIEPAAWTKV
jgi:hypothetical protein